MKDLRTVDLDLISPTESREVAENARTLERFRAAYQQFPPELKRGIREVVNTDHDRAFDQQARMVLEFLNLKRTHGRPFRPVEANLRLIRARLAEGVTIEELRAIVALKVRQADRGQFGPQYLRPATLFNAEKCNQYIGELGRG